MTVAAVCSQCDARAVRALGVDAFCGEHYRELLSRFDPAVFEFRGVGLPVGRARPDLGEGVVVLACCACDATWCGPVGESCPWCRAAAEHLAAHTRAMLLALPEIHEGDDADVVLRAWGGRLRRAVDAEIITRTEAERAWKRAVGHVAA